MLSQNDIIYFILTDRFYDGDAGNNTDVDLNNPCAYHGGDFSGIIKKIPYLRDLGITALWITPVYENTNLPQKNCWGYHGYWPKDFEKIDAHLYTPIAGIPEGSKQYLKMLADALHENGIKLILDMVVNHVGYNHPVFRQEKGTRIKETWFNKPGLLTDEEVFLAGLPDLDQHNMEVADYFINITLDWIEETGIDCIRMDTVKNVEHIFWYYFKTYVKGKYPDVSLLGEVLVTDIDQLSQFQQHFAFDSLFDFPLQKAMTEIFIGDSSFNILARPGLYDDEIPGILNKDNVYTNHNRLVTLLDNHDLPMRFISGILSRYGNDRRTALAVYKMSLTFMMTTRGIPQIFYGNEIGMEGLSDPDNRRDMPWSIFGADQTPMEKYGFEREIYLHMKSLIAFRKGNQALCWGSLVTLYADQYIYAYLREFRGNVVIVAMNNGHDPMGEPLTIDIGDNNNIPQRVKDIIESKSLPDFLGASGSISVNNARFAVKLGGKTSAVYFLS